MKEVTFIPAHGDVRLRAFGINYRDGSTEYLFGDGSAIMIYPQANAQNKFEGTHDINDISNIFITAFNSDVGTAYGWSAYIRYEPVV